jgi:hypothetical protein
MDKIRIAWLETQQAQAQALADASDLLEVQRVDRQRFVARFHAKTFVCGPDGEVGEVTGYEIGYTFRENYLRHVEPLEVLSWLHPRGVFHPNARAPVCCIGHITPGTPLVDLLYRTYEVVSGQNVMPDEKDALNPVACQWARNNPHRFPLDNRPLKRRSLDGQPGALELPGSLGLSRSLELPK